MWGHGGVDMCCVMGAKAAFKNDFCRAEEQINVL